MYNDTFDFYKVEKYRKHLDFNLLYNKIKQELYEEFQTSCNDWEGTDISKIGIFDSYEEALENAIYDLITGNVNFDVNYEK